MRRRGFAIVLCLALLGVVYIGEAATAATKANPAGVGTAEALASPDCDAKAGDPKTGRIKIPSIIRPPCVKPWPAGKDNGGATAQGVTATSIKLVARVPSLESQKTLSAAGSTSNRGTGKPGTYQDAYRDIIAIGNQAFRTWGRKVEVEFVTSSGTDEAAQRADAAAVAEKKPFAVMEWGASGPVFETEIANRKIVIISIANNSAKVAEAQAPYRWAGTDERAGQYAMLEFLGKSIIGKPAKFAGKNAGDPALSTKTRAFAFLHDDAVTTDFSILMNGLKKQFPKTKAIEVTYTAGDANKLQEQAPALISKLKSEGITTVYAGLTGHGVLASLTAQATLQNYWPEWGVTPFGSMDYDAWGNLNDQKQWSNAFGLGRLPIFDAGDTSGGARDIGFFTWFWGPAAGTYHSTMLTDIKLLFFGIHMAGPKLTTQTFRDGMFNLPPMGGAADGSNSTYMQAFGNAVIKQYKVYMYNGVDYTLVWYDSQQPGKANTTGTAVPAKYWYLEGGKRFLNGQLPKGELPFFDKTKSIFQTTETPPKDKLPVYPCTGCPSSGGTLVPNTSGK